ncbi:uncharacterized protein LOC117120332 [Anneissia japonica]|uniref:uncharacterized protein LOC117120332 n=1 Tax=Anneissia japonica TaxID=1529436 RepID=UPI0014254C37|nr:uncharacterized protein LOC117120332 [Anneissia japonica]
MSAYLSVQHSSSSSLPPSSSYSADLHSTLNASSSSNFASAYSSQSSPLSSRNHENEVQNSNNEDPYKFEASRILSGIYGLLVTFVGICIINAAVIIPGEAPSKSVSSANSSTPPPGLNTIYNNNYLAFVSAIGLLFILSTFAYDVYIYRTYVTSIIDTTSSNTLQGLAILISDRYRLL